MSEFCHSGIVLKLLPDSRVYAIEILFNWKSKRTKNSFRIETLFVLLITKMYLHSYLIGWLQNYGSKKALFCGMITLLNE